MIYRIFTLDSDDRATSLRTITAADDKDALDAAQALSPLHFAVEIWRADGPLVARLGEDVTCP